MNDYSPALINFCKLIIDPVLAIDNSSAELASNIGLKVVQPTFKHNRPLENWITVYFWMMIDIIS